MKHSLLGCFKKIPHINSIFDVVQRRGPCVFVYTSLLNSM